MKRRTRLIIIGCAIAGTSHRRKRGFCNTRHSVPASRPAGLHQPVSQGGGPSGRSAERPSRRSPERSRPVANGYGQSGDSRAPSAPVLPGHGSNWRATTILPTLI